VWAAIEAYLSKAGRLGKMADEEYLFVPLTDRAKRLPGVGQDWTPEGPLSAREVRRLVKRYAKKAGLDPSEVHVHTLRHTAAELYKANGDDIYAVSKLLNHSSVKVTQGYFDHMEGHNNVTWRKVAAGLQLRGDW
jgi:integrase